MPKTYAIIPCGNAKRDHAAAARDLYTGPMFAHALRAAEHACDEVLILSARHGLVALDAILDPYDVQMGDAGSVGPDCIMAQALALGLTDADVYAFLPARYFATLDAGLRMIDVYAADVYEADAGIGYQRRTCNDARLV